MPPETAGAQHVTSSGELPTPADADDERTLVTAVLQRDRKAAADFVERYADQVYSYVSRRLAPRADFVEDVVQDVFLVAFQKLDTFTAQSSVIGWLLGIARHKVEDVYRAQLREADPFPDDGDIDVASSVDTNLEDQIDAARAQEKARRILEQLPAPYSVALLWRYWERRSARDMAAQSGKTEKAIERLLARARAEFKRLWEASRP